jgi:hypothetical protein
MALIVIAGDIGSGKTLLMTYMALKDPRPVFANYFIDRPGWNILTPATIERLNHPALILIDEGYVWLESRISSSLVNRYWSQVLFQSRKRQLDIVITCQLVSTIDKRFREMADLYIVAERKPEGFVYTCIKPGRKRVLRFMLTNEVAEQIFPRYDTMELVTSIDAFMVASCESEPEELNRVVNDLVEKLRSETKGQSVKRPYIEDFCLRHGFPAKFAKYIFNRVSVGASEKETE